MYYTYVMRSLKDNLFFTGLTRDLKQRFEQHQKGRILIKKWLKSYLTG